MDLAHEFPLASELVYLNHAAVAPWPRRTHDAVCGFAAENLAFGARNYPEWLQKNKFIYKQIKELINADSSDEIALVKNTSEGLSFVANGIDWTAGDEIVISDEEFPSNRIVWEALAAAGVAVRAVPLRHPDRSPEEQLMAACSERTRLISISAVQYASGLRMDLPTLGAFARARGILFCVDAIQSIGAEAFDVQAAQADFAIADGHKWMLGPEGLGLFYVRAPLIESLKLSEYGWNMVADAGDYDKKSWEPAATARRFECGSPNMLGIYALSASLSLLLEAGLDAISRDVIRNSSYLIEFIENDARFELLSPKTPGRYLGIVVFRSRGSDDDALFASLRDAGVVCARRGGGIRFSPHFYTPQEALDRALSILDERVGRRASA